MVNQIHKGTMPAFIALGGVSLSLCLPSLSDSLLPLIHLNSFSLSLPFFPLHPFLLFSSPPLLPCNSPFSFPFFPASFSPRCSTKIRLWFWSLQTLSSAFNFGGGSSRLRCYGNCTVWLWLLLPQPQLKSPKQCPAKCRFLALFRALFPSNRASGLKWAMCLDTTTIPTPPLNPPPSPSLFLPPSTSLIY